MSTDRGRGSLKTLQKISSNVNFTLPRHFTTNSLIVVMRSMSNVEISGIDSYGNCGEGISSFTKIKGLCLRGEKNYRNSISFLLPTIYKKDCYSELHFFTR